MESNLSLPWLRLHKKLNSSGQSSVEYILLAVVVIAITLGLLNQFSTAFVSWGQNYFGEYVGCLLETGELPSLGYEGQGQNESVCEADFQPFSLANGRPPTPIRLTPSDPISQGSVARTDSDPQGTRVSSGSGSGGGAEARGSGGRIPVTRFDGGFKPAGVPEGGSPTAGGKVADDSGDQVIDRTNSIAEAGGGIGTLGRPQRVPVEQAKDKVEDLKRKKVPTVEGEINEKGDVIPLGQGKKREAASIEEGWDFGDWFRILLIIAIVIAILFFFAGQAVQIAKSQEK